jgi:predicted transcriptional regulator
MADVELNTADRAIIEVLSQGRNTPGNIARDREYTREYIANRMKRLVEHDLVDRVDRGLYELTANPEDVLD